MADTDDFLDAMSAIAREARAASNELYADLGLGNAQAKLLRYIGRHPGVSQAELARATVSDAALTGRFVEAMVARGLVLRKRSKDDRRLYVLELSAAGHRVKERIETARRVLAKRVVAALDERDLRDFDRVAKKILAAAPFISGRELSSRGEDRPPRRASRARGRRSPPARR